MPKKRLDNVASFENPAATDSFVRPEDLLQVSMPVIEAAALNAACQADNILDLDIKDEASEEEFSPEGEWHRVLDSKPENSLDGETENNTSSDHRSRVRLTLKLKKSKRKSPGSYGCDSCDDLFPSEKTLSLHKRYKHGSATSSEGPEKESCDICGSEFQDIFRLSLHKRHKHLVQVPLQHAAEKNCGNDDPVTVKDESEAAEEDLACDLCSSRFPDEHSLSDHRKITHKEGFEEHKIPCSFCGRTFNNHSKLKAHYDRHFKEKLKWSLKKTKGKQKKHPDASHDKAGSDTGEDKSEEGAGVLHRCDLCGMSFPKEYRLRLHKRFKHLDERSTELVCELCGRGFKRPYSLKLHLMRHLGEKPFQCELCGKQAASSGDLKKHTILHTGVKPYKCTLCQKSFAYKNILTEHMNTHTGARPYLCDICGKAFSHYRTFGNHHRLHTGNTPYVCTLCGKKFAQLTGFNYHKKHHHNSVSSTSQSTATTTTSTVTTATKTLRDFFSPTIPTSLDFDKKLPSNSGGSSSSVGNSTAVSSHHEEPVIMNPFDMSASLSSEIIDRIPSMKEEVTPMGVHTIPNLECALANLPEKMMRIGNMTSECERVMPVTNINPNFPHFPMLYPPFSGTMSFRHPY